MKRDKEVCIKKILEKKNGLRIRKAGIKKKKEERGNYNALGFSSVRKKIPLHKSQSVKCKLRLNPVVSADLDLVDVKIVVGKYYDKDDVPEDGGVARSSYHISK